MHKVAFVVQRYGMEVNGGSELCCRLTAEHMAKYWEVEVITTCAIDYMTWKNEYNPGKDIVNGVHVWRFPVDKERNIKKFNNLSERLYWNENKKEDELNWIKLQGPYSADLLNYIEEKRDYYDYFIFFTYLYCTTFFGLPLVKEKAILVPTAHDEPPIYFKAFDELFAMPANLVYLTRPEKDFLARRFKNPTNGPVIGMGIDCPDDINGDRFCRKYNLGKNFLLYVGRIDLSKGCGELFDFFKKYKNESKNNVKLVLIGKSHANIPQSEDIIHLGFVSEQDKFDALDAAKLLIIPSPYESFSIVTLEAFITKTPVLANGKCLVLKDQCINSNGGLYYTDFYEFSECLDFLLTREDVTIKMGNQGKEFVERNYDWNQVENKYIEVLNFIGQRDK